MNTTVIAFDLEELKEIMERKKLDTLDDIENTAYLTQSNFGGMVILVNKSGDGVFVQEVWDSGSNEIEEAEIFYDEEWEYGNEGEAYAYFDYRDEKYYLAEFMRKNY